MQSADTPDLVKPASPDGLRALRRSLVVRDATTFAALAAITVVLFGITLALFRSFEAHREDLGRRWTAQARAALLRHDPAAAVPDLRAALSYAPDDRGNQLLLAEALAGSGHENEAGSYFLNLWGMRPGDGFVNLQLARLARRRGDAAQASEYYRAAIFGDWGDQGPVRRRECRLELADFLIERGELDAARVELQIAGSNAPASASVLLQIGEQMAMAGDFAAALGVYARALQAEPDSGAALLHALAAALLTGAYGKAEELFAHVPHEGRRLNYGARSFEGAPEVEVSLLARDARRLGELSMSRELPGAVRARHLLAGSDIAQARLRACSTGPVLPGSEVAALKAQWKGSARELRRQASAGNADAQDSLANLIFESERATADLPNIAGCGEPVGDDLLLLVLAPTQGRSGAPLAAVRDYQAHLKAIATGRPTGRAAEAQGS